MIVCLLPVDVTRLGDRSLSWDSDARIERTSDKMTWPGLRTMRPTRAAEPVLDLAERPFVGETHSTPPGASRIPVCGVDDANRPERVDSLVDQVSVDRHDFVPSQKPVVVLLEGTRIVCRDHKEPQTHAVGPAGVLWKFAQAGGHPLHPRVSFHCDETAPPSGYGISGRCSADAPSVPAPDGSAPLTGAASGATPDGLRARRKP